MKRLVNYLFCCAAMALLHGCTTTSYETVTRKATAKTRFISQSGISETTMVTDLEVDNHKVSGSFSGTNVNEESAKSLAVANALKNANAEVLVEPLFEIEIRNYKDITVQVQGYPARYKNFRTPGTEDSLLLGLKRPPADTVYIATGSQCCGGNASTILFSGGAARQEANNPFQVTTPAAKPEAGASNFDTDKFRRDYIARYERLKKAGKRRLTWGILCTVTGSVFLGVAPIFYEDTDSYYSTGEGNAGYYSFIGSGSALVAVGIPLIPVGIAKLARAGKMKREAPQHGIQLALRPQISPFTRTYGAGLCMTF